MTEIDHTKSRSVRLTGKQRKRFRQIAHHLQPVVTVAEKGLSEAVINETQRALKDHELIKVKLNIADRHARMNLGTELAQHTHSDIVQTIGKIIVLYRENPSADASLSNVSRYQD